MMVFKTQIRVITIENYCKFIFQSRLKIMQNANFKQFLQPLTIPVCPKAPKQTSVIKPLPIRPLLPGLHFTMPKL